MSTYDTDVRFCLLPTRQANIARLFLFSWLFLLAITLNAVGRDHEAPERFCS